MTRMTMAAAAAAALLGATAGPVWAQSPEAQAEYRRNCTSDYTRLCSAFDPGSQQVQQCFQQNMQRLSAACRATIAKYQPAGRQRPR